MARLELKLGKQGRRRVEGSPHICDARAAKWGLFRDPRAPWREEHSVSAWRCPGGGEELWHQGPGFPSTPGSGRRLQEAGHPALSPRASVGAASGPFGCPQDPRLISFQGTLPSGGAFVYTQRPKPSSPGAAEPSTLESPCQRKAGVISEGSGAQGHAQEQCWEPASPQGGCLSELPGGASSEDSRGG